jgi:hypothetical protein
VTGITASREQRRQLERDNAKQPAALADVPRADWPESVMRASLPPRRVLRSREFLVQLFEAPGPATVRLSVCRTTLKGDRWDDNITWDELQRVKAEAGYPWSWAVEIYPPAVEVVNVANMRHLWLLPEAPAFAWRRGV